MRTASARTGAETAVLKGHVAGIESAAFSPNGKRVVTASYDNTARLWDTITGGEIAVLKGHGSPVYSAAFSPDGTRVVTKSDDAPCGYGMAQRSRGAMPSPSPASDLATILILRCPGPQ
jgi:WD40 repeat protein